MREREHPLEHVEQVRGRVLVAVVEPRLDDLQVPVAELRPEERVEAEHARGRSRSRRAPRRRRRPSRCSRETIQRSSTSAAVGPRPRGLGLRAALSRISREAFHILFARSRPCWIAVGRVAHVLGRGHRQQAEAQRVGAVDVDLVERVDPGAERLRHPPSVGRLDDRGDVDVVERDVAGELDPHHHHPRDPEEDDVARRGQEAGGIEGVAAAGRLVGPAEGRERPQRRAEPGVEHVRLLASARPGRSRARRPPRGRAPPSRRRSPRRRARTRPGSGGPTRAGARRTTAGCCRIQSR